MALLNAEPSFTIVAGPGFAPGSEGYEPSEILLLHPAIWRIIVIFDFFTNLNYCKFFKNFFEQSQHSFCLALI